MKLGTLKEVVLMFENCNPYNPAEADVARVTSAQAAPLARLKAASRRVVCDNCPTLPFLVVLQAKPVVMQL